MTEANQPNWKTLFSTSNFAMGTLLIVPTVLVRNMVAEEILSSREVLMGPRVLTFTQLENLLADEMGPAPVDRLLRLMALNSVAPEIWDPLGLPGLPTPDRVLELAEQMGDGLDRLRLAGITSDILETYEPKSLTGVLAKNGRRYYSWLGDRDDHFTRRSKLLEALKSGRKFKALEDVEAIHCSHSKRLSPFEAELIKALSTQKRVELRMSAPKWLLEEKIPPGTSYHRLRFIRDLETTAGPGLNLIWTDPGDTVQWEIPPALRYASENLFGPPPTEPAPDPTGVLAITAFPTRFYELEDIGRKIKALLIQGVPAHRVTAIVPNVPQWLPGIYDVAMRFGIPIRYPRGSPLSVYPPVTALLDLFSLWGSNWEINRILKILETPYFDFDLEGPLRPHIFEIGTSDDRASGGFKVNYEKIVDQDLKEKLKPVYLAITRLKQAEMNLMAAKTWKSFRDRLQSILKGFLWPGPMLPEPRGRGYEKDYWLRTTTDPRAVQLMADVLTKLFDALVSSQHSPPVSLDSFKLWLKAAMAGVTLEIHGGHTMGVKILSYEDLHGAFFDSLFLMGMNDKVFPSAKAESCWWPDDLVESLANSNLGRRLWYSASESYSREEDIVAQALVQAKRVHISYQSSTDDMRPALPSPVVESLIELFPDGILRVKKSGWPIPPQPENVCDPGDLWLNLVVSHPTKEAPEIFKRLSTRSLEETEGLWASIWARRKSLDLYQEKMPPELLRAWLDTQHNYEGRPNLSIRHLTVFSDCPRKFWYQEILNLFHWGGAMEVWPSADQGEVIHATLERFLEPLIKGETKDYGPSRLKYIYWELVHRQYCFKAVGRKPIFDALTLKLETALMAWIQRHKDLAKSQLEAIEWSFGGRQGNDAPPYKVDSPSGSFYLSGRIDRIDWEGGHVVVRDYKTNRSSYYNAGGRKPKEGPRPSWHYPMVLYGLVAQDHFKAEAEPIIEFVDPREGKDQLTIEPGDSSELAQLWENLLDGTLTTPQDQKLCGNCDFVRLCRPQSRVGVAVDGGEEVLSEE
ncbi:MAG: PD-(D/E)XK nuclease family protein [Deltaproteobacteria bacterium]|jgi:hypothetical protein|nr:PD-(D/E)XK nuclease family protein [Deltaproteobacteria bacterium]